MVDYASVFKGELQKKGLEGLLFRIMYSIDLACCNLGGGVTSRCYRRPEVYGDGGNVLSDNICNMTILYGTTL